MKRPQLSLSTNRCAASAVAVQRHPTRKMAAVVALLLVGACDGDPAVTGLRQTGPTGTISLSPSTLTYSATEGGSNPESQILHVSNAGDGSLDWSAAVDAPWLTAVPVTGVSTGETDNVTVAVNTAGLAAGSYTATITVAAAGASNTPQTVAVAFELVEPAPVISRSPASLTFSGVEDESNPASQTLGISNAGGGTLSWAVSDDQGWLSLSPTSGTSTG
jgi:hypothetical protein